MQFSALSKEELQQQVNALTQKLAAIEADKAIIQDQERCLREIFNTTLDAIFIHDSSTGAIVDVNDTMLLLYGYGSKDEVLNCNTSNLSALEEGYTEERAQSLMQRALKSDIKSFEWRAKRKSGENFWVEVTLQRIGVGACEQIMATVHDLTQIHKHWDALTQSEKSYKNLYLMLRMICDNVEDMLWAKDTNNCYIFANKAMCENLFNAQSLSEPVGKTDMFFATRERESHPENPEWHTFGEMCRDTDSIVLASKKTERFSEYGNVKGEFLFLDVYKSPFYDEAGNIIGTVGSGRNITQEKRLAKEHEDAQQQLAQSEEKYRTLFESMPNGYYLSTPEGRLLSTNSAFVRMLGYDSKEELMAVDIPSTLYVAPEERDIIVADNKEFTSASEVYRLKRKDGKIIWVEDNARYIKDSSDNILFYEGICRDITERIEAVDALRKSEERFRTLVDSFPDPIVIYIGATIVFINQVGLEFLRATSVDQVLGRPVWDFVSPETMEFGQKRIEQAIKERKNSPLVEQKFVRLDGSVADVETIIIPTFYDGKPALATIAHDITSVKKDKEKIEMLTKGIEQSPVSIIITDTSGIIEYVNPNFSKVTGFSFEEAVGQKPNIIKSNETSLSYYQNLWNTILSGNDWHGEFYNRAKNGVGFWEFASISPIKNSKGVITHFIAVKEDITERKQTELILKNKNEEYQEVNQRLIAANNELSIAKERAEESDRLKSAFLSNMSHEIRTPMNAIMGFSKLLCEPRMGNESRMEYATILTGSCERLLNTVNDVLDISKIQAGQMKVNAQSFFVGTVFKELAALYTGSFAKKGIAFVVDLDPILTQHKLYSDEQKVYQVLNNLLSNALKYTNSGRVQLGSRVKNDSLEIFVTDTGVGISPESHGFVFERFTQENMTYSRGYEGTGLGLAISKSLAVLLSGDISLQSEKGKGSTFTFTLPFTPKLEDDATLTDDSNLIAVLPKELSVTILVAEDDDFSFILAKKIIQDIPGIVLLRARTGEEAVLQCRENDAISLVLMDIKMPVLDGLTATKQIREFNTNVPIVALTAYALADDKDKALRAGCNAYISKPYDHDELLQTIVSLIGNPPS